MAEENKNKKTDSKKPKPSSYWIYGAIILMFYCNPDFWRWKLDTTRKNNTIRI